MIFVLQYFRPYMGKKSVESTSINERNVNQMSPLQSNLLDFIVDNFPSPEPFLVDSKNNDFFNLPLSDDETTKAITLANNFDKIGPI